MPQLPKKLGLFRKQNKFLLYSNCLLFTVPILGQESPSSPSMCTQRSLGLHNATYASYDNKKLKSQKSRQQNHLVIFDLWLQRFEMRGKNILKRRPTFPELSPLLLHSNFSKNNNK